MSYFVKHSKLNIFRLILTIVALLACSCSVDDANDVESHPVARGAFSLTIEASKIETQAMARALSLHGNTLNAHWMVGEEVSVYNGDDLLGIITAQNSGESATLSGTISGDISIGDKLTLKYLSPSYSAQDGTLEYISTHCDYCVATVTVREVGDNGKVTIVESAAAFENQQAIVRFVLKNKDLEGFPALMASALTLIGAESKSIVVKPAVPSNELIVAIPAVSDVDFTISATVNGNLYQYTKENAKFSASHYYTITVKLTEVPNGVDLGLPSGTVWASKNLGAADEAEAGLYFAWGETMGYASDHVFNWASYVYSGNEINTLSKYNNIELYGSVVDNKLSIEATDDAAMVIWGAPWHLPATQQVDELIENTDKMWTSGGLRLISKNNGNAIFLPSAGYYDGTIISEKGVYGYYWLNSVKTSNPNSGHTFNFQQGYSGEGYWWNSFFRCRGQSIRAVR